MLSWVVSNILEISEPSAMSDSLLECRAHISLGLLTHIQAKNFDIVMMCMFMLSQQTVNGMNLIESQCKAECAMRIVSLIHSTDEQAALCQNKANLGETDTSGNTSKLLYWAYRALNRLLELRAVRFDQRHSAGIQHVCSASLLSVMTTLSEKPSRFSLPSLSSVAESGKEGYLLPLVQLEFLQHAPIASLGSCRAQLLAECGLIVETIRYVVIHYAIHYVLLNLLCVQYCAEEVLGERGSGGAQRPALAPLGASRGCIAGIPGPVCWC